MVLKAWAPVAAYGGLLLAIFNLWRVSSISHEEKHTQLLADALRVQVAIMDLRDRHKALVRWSERLAAKWSHGEYRQRAEKIHAANEEQLADMEKMKGSMAETVAAFRSIPKLVPTAKMESIRRDVVWLEGNCERSLKLANALESELRDFEATVDSKTKVG